MAGGRSIVEMDFGKAEVLSRVAFLMARALVQPGPTPPAQADLNFILNFTVESFLRHILGS